jgi:hypothetical protein
VARKIRRFAAIGDWRGSCFEAGMPATTRAGLYLCPPPSVRPRESRVRAFVRPPLRAVSRALLRLADFTMRLGLVYAGLAAAAAATVLA